MTVIICIDDNNGMMFNNRRQSQDRVLRDRIISLTNGKRLWMNNYSYKQFALDTPSQINIDDACLSKAMPNDYCFVENIDIKPYIKWIDKIIVYKWNRKYPSDMKFDYSMSDNGWTLQSTYEFSGYSHEKITEEVYVK